MGELRRLASQGIPDGASIRATVWKLLLGYLPADRSLWPFELAKKRSQFKNFKEELLMNPLLSLATLVGAVFCFAAFCFKSLYAFLALFAIGELLVFATQD